VPHLCGCYPGFCLTTEEKARQNLSQGSRRDILILITLQFPLSSPLARRNMPLLVVRNLSSCEGPYAKQSPHYITGITAIYSINRSHYMNGLVSGLSSRSLGFSPWTIGVGCVVDKMVPRHVSPLIISLPMFINHLSFEFTALGTYVVAVQSTISSQFYNYENFSINVSRILYINSS
jgi:hypothetical protein